MEQWEEIRRRVLVRGESKRQIQRETGMHWKTLTKILSHSIPPGYRKKCTRPKPKLGPYLERIAEIIESDKAFPRKQRHTAKRIYERLKEEGYTGGYTQVKGAVREIKQYAREVFMPLLHRPGDAQVDYGHALVKENGVLCKVVFFAMSLPYSDALFVMAFERECTETFWEGHVRAFEFFGGVPRRITYDNTKITVAKILGAHSRRLTAGFLQLKSHYLFDHHFCQVRRANEKGVVESTVKYTRLNFFVPVPQVHSLEELNAYLLTRCQEDLSRHLRGQKAPKRQLLEEERSAFLPLSEVPFDACRKVSTAANTLSLVRFDSNDYSVPVRYAHRPVVVKGYVDRVAMCHKGEIVATHRRIWDKEKVSYEPVHYLALLERKPGALDHARPLEEWNLPACFTILRRRLEDELEGRGTREFIAVLRLLETHSLSRVRIAVEQALRFRRPVRDVVAQFLFSREEWRAPTFRLEGREHLRLVKVARPDLSAYQHLIGQGGPR
jgi:transposase